MQKLTSSIALLAPPLAILQTTREKILFTPDSSTLSRAEAFWQEMKTFLFTLGPNNPADIKT